MHKPTDYPLDTDQSALLADIPVVDITYATLKDRVDAKQPITDEMIRIAVTKLETANASQVVSRMETPEQTAQLKSKLNSLRNRFRAQ